MDIDQLIEIEIATRDILSALEKEATEHDTAPPGKLDGTEGRLSRQDSLMQHELGKETHRRRVLRIQHLKAALERMDAGEYGLCNNCGVEIEYSRLQIQPETQVCGKCAR